MGQNINTGNFGGKIIGNYSSIWKFFYYISYFKNDHLTFKKIFFFNPVKIPLISGFQQVCTIPQKMFGNM